MDETITIGSMKKIVKEFCEARDWDLMSDQTVRSHIQEELADTLFFLLRFAQMNDIDLYDALTDKVNKNGQRYTIENSKGKNIKIHG